MTTKKKGSPLGNCGAQDLLTRYCAEAKCSSKCLCVVGFLTCFLSRDPPRLSFVSSVVFSWSPSFLSSQRANADSNSASASALVVVPSATKKNIGQWEAVSALTTPQQRLHEREILIHKVASALTTPQERLHERERLLIQNHLAPLPTTPQEHLSPRTRTPPHPQIIQRH